MYASQTGKPAAGNEEFLENLEEEVPSVPITERLIVAGDYNCHVGCD